MRWRISRHDSNVPLGCPTCRETITEGQLQLIQFGRQRLLDNERETNEIVDQKY
jgi:hypothetical protein